MKIRSLIALALATVVSLPVVVSAAGQHHKPLSPLAVSLLPVNQELAPADIKPGDSVDLAVSVSSSVDAPEMRITVELSGGAELMNGKTSWTGAAVKNSARSFVITVRSPLTGTGVVRTRAVLSDNNGNAFGGDAVFSLGEQKPDGLQKKAVRKNAAGRDVLEFTTE